MTSQFLELLKLKIDGNFMSGAPRRRTFLKQNVGELGQKRAIFSKFNDGQSENIMNVYQKITIHYTLSSLA